MDFNVIDYAHLLEGEKLYTKAVQAAIDDCAAAGGGRVIIRDGVYTTGTITLKSNVNLHIEESGVLLGSPDCDDYPERTDVKHVNSVMLPRRRNACLIFAEECENISITGMGKIDCNGLSFVEEVENYTGGWRYKRIAAPTPPRAVFFTGCKNVNVKDVTMVNQPAGWGYWIHDCDFVSFDRVKVIADVQYPNNDGIHINCCSNVTISNCSIVCGDDCIVVRANSASLSENKVCERVVVTNCNLTSYASGIRIGWLNDGVIRNCTFSNIVMTDTNVGIAIKLPYGGEKEYEPGNCPQDLPLYLVDRGREETLIENLSFNNIIMDEIYSTPIAVEIADCKATKCKAIRNLFFNGIHARGLEFPYFKGRTENVIKNIKICNCTFEKVSDEQLPNYKEHGATWGRPINNTIFNHVEDIALNGTSFTNL
ncbi:MAG: right-handed parallel beta-helix repeat-containing protein [Clostridia bacterium]|nr:right-handed parallel beta-helix repeat-containing protein [Clostridia bacterium]